MVWVKYKEKFHRSTYVFWKQHKTMANAKKLVASWNRFKNPTENLRILKHQTSKPKNLKKGEAPGIYFEK